MQFKELAQRIPLKGTAAQVSTLGNFAIIILLNSRNDVSKNYIQSHLKAKYIKVLNSMAWIGYNGKKVCNKTSFKWIHGKVVNFNVANCSRICEEEKSTLLHYGNDHYSKTTSYV